MVENVQLVIAFVSAIVGMGWLALAKPAHWRQVTALPLERQASGRLTLAGSLGLLVSMIFCFLADRPSMAILVWVLALAFSSVFVAIVLASRPGLLTPLLIKAKS